MLYRIATWNWPLKLHSAQTIFIALTLFALLSNKVYLLIFIISFRLTIYVYRKIFYAEKNWLIPIFRIILALATIIATIISELILLTIIFFAIGEIIDRIEFYNELNVPKPQEELYKFSS